MDPLRNALRLRLGTQLRIIRRRAGMSGAAVGERINVSQSKVSRIEAGTLWPAIADIEAWLTACGVDQGEERARVIALAEAIEHGVTTLRDLHRGSLEVRQHEMVGLDAAAARVRHLQPLVIPGLFHTADYARACIQAANLHGERDVDAAVAARMTRVKRMRTEGAPAYQVVMTEGALRWVPATAPDSLPEVWQSILDAAASPNITVQVVPTGAPMTALPTCGYTVHEFTDGRPELVIVETPAAELTFAGTTEVADFVTVFDRMAKAALSPKRSLALIRSLIPGTTAR